MEKIKEQAPQEIDTSFERAIGFHDCIKDQMKKFHETTDPIKFRISLLNSSKVEKIVESSQSSQSKTVSTFNNCERKIDLFFKKIEVKQIDFEKIVTVCFPKDFSFELNDFILVNRDRTPKSSVGNRLSVNLAMNKIFSPVDRIFTRNDSSCDKSREKRSSFLSRKMNDKQSAMTDMNFEGFQKGNVSHQQLKRNNSHRFGAFKSELQIQRADSLFSNDSGLRPLPHLGESYKEKRAQHTNLNNYCIKETQEENLLLNSNVQNELINQDIEVEFKKINNEYEKPSRLVYNRDINGGLFGEEMGRSKSPMRAGLDLLKKVRSSDHMKTELAERQENPHFLRVRVDSNFDSQRFDLSRSNNNNGNANKSRASSKNISNIYINLDDFSDKPTHKVGELLKNLKNTKPPYIDLSAGR